MIFHFSRVMRAVASSVGGRDLARFLIPGVTASLRSDAFSPKVKVYMAGNDDSPYRAHLSKIPMFGSCTSEQLDRLAELGDTRTTRDSDDVVREGDKGGTFFLIASGRARVTRRGREVDMLGPGDYFGELSLFDPAPRDATITAVGPLSSVALSRVAFMQALDEIPTFRDSLLHGMARRLHELDQRV